jgi:hypothetical protein
MKWELGEELDNRIIKYDGWLDLIDVEAPGEQGVFVFVDENMEVLYVGYAPNNLDEELRIAFNYGMAQGATMYSWYIASSKNACISLKQYWVDKYMK